MCANNIAITMLKNNIRKYIAYYIRFEIIIKQTKTLLLRAQ
jgi:hypothetical protein